MSIVVGENYTEPGATATDDTDGVVDVSWVGEVNTGEIGIYTVKYTAMDSSGNSITVERIVNVIKEKDEIKPVITLNGNSEIIIVKNETYIELSAEAEDNVDGVVSVTLEGEVDTSTAGDYTLTYSAKDSSNNEATKTRTVHVVLSEVGQLLEDAAKGTNTNVHYVVVGDSTRNNPFSSPSNTILVDSYYENQLNRIDVDFSHTAYSGIEAYRWKENNSNYPGGKTKPRLDDTLNKIPSSNHSNYIVEFSLGINDTKYDYNKDDLKIIIKDSIQKLRTHRPNLKILMVSPVAYTFNDLTSETMEEIYKEVYKELISEGATYLAFVSGREATKDVTDCLNDGDTCAYYSDSIHPAKDGSLRLVNYIFSEIGGSRVHETMTVSSDDSPTHMSLDDMHKELDIRLEER